MSVVYVYILDMYIYIVNYILVWKLMTDFLDEEFLPSGGQKIKKLLLKRQ